MGSEVVTVNTSGPKFRVKQKTQTRVSHCVIAARPRQEHGRPAWSVTNVTYTLHGVFHPFPYQVPSLKPRRSCWMHSSDQPTVPF
jgi:hypothetical protein